MLSFIIWFVGIAIALWLAVIVFGFVSEMFTPDVKPNSPSDQEKL